MFDCRILKRVCLALTARSRAFALAVAALALAPSTTVAATATFDDFVSSVNITVDGYAGASTLANFPLLVRVSSDLLPGFVYADATKDGAPDVRFFDAGGALLKSDCDTWNPSGESLFWVRLPSLAPAGTTLTMAWNLKKGFALPDASGAFEGYTGVWHMDEAKDSSPNNATSTFGPQRQAVEGILGGASGATTTGANGAHLVTDYYTALDQCSTAATDVGFTVSMWVNLNTLSTDWAYLFSRKQNDDTTSWGLQFCGSSGNANNWRYFASSNASGIKWTLKVNPSSKLPINDWHKVDFTHYRLSSSKTQLKVYIDGAIYETLDTGNYNNVLGTDGFSIGGLAGSGHGLLNGSTDECRLSPTIASADWVKAEYDQVKADDFISYGDVKTVSVVSFDGAEISYSGGEGTLVKNEAGVDELVIKYTNPYEAGMLSLPAQVQAWVLAVGGGGAGANPAGATARQGGAGGGGAGGYVENKNQGLKAGSYMITVGAGGEVQAASVQANGGNGHPSVIALNGTDVVRALGGGGGGMLSAGLAGGSGGGASKGANGGAGTADQGNKGGDCASVNTAGAGGGGAGGAGGSVTTAGIGGVGGAGRATDITGEMIAYAGGGGGGTRSGTGGSASAGGGVGGGATSAGNGVDGLGGGGGGGRLNEAGGRGGRGVVIIRIKLVMPAKPESETLAYDGAEHEIFPKDEAKYTLSGDLTDDGRAAATRVGTYTFTATLKPGLVWADGSSGPVTFTLKITQPNLFTKSFVQAGWQLGETRPLPELVMTAGPTGPEVALTDDQVVYEYASSATGPWNTAVPTTAGTWYIRATIAETADFLPPATAPVTSFRTWAGSDGPVETLGYHAVLTVNGYTGTDPLVDFPMLVRVKENEPEGFRYSQAQADGSDIRFFSPDGTTQLPYEVETWNPDGESMIWVKVPSYANGDVAIMTWGLLAETVEKLPSTDVWSNYHGVWHLNEEIDAAHAATTKSLDATANKLDATPTKNANGNATASVNQMVSLPGVLGNGRVNSNVASVQNGTRLQTARVVDHGDTFTVSGWFRMNKAEQYPRLFGTKNNNDAPGFSVEATKDSTKAFAVRSNINADGENKTYGNVGTANLLNTWVYITVVYDGAFCRFYSNGERPASGVVQIPACAASTLPLSFGANGNGGEWSLNGAYDELRWAKTALTADWIKAEYVQMALAAGMTATGPTATWGPAIQKPNATFLNRWVVDPVLPVTEWGTGEEPVIVPGTPAYGGPAYFVITSVGGETFRNSFPTTAGSYTLVFYVDEGTLKPEGTMSWTALATDPVAVEVTAHSPRTDLSGTAGSATLSGRVLLANNDSNPAAPITDQDYNQTAETSPAIYWEHEGDDRPLENLFPNIKPSSAHRLIAGSPVDELNQATTIWTLTDVYIGTPYSIAGREDEANRNFLPYSSTSADKPEAADYLLLRNLKTATITSPCYMNGVGTIYFDAVNGWNRDAGIGYNLVVEVVKGTDALADSIADEKWQSLEMKPLLRDITVGPAFVPQEATTELALAVTNGMSSLENFYRIVVPVECHEPARFRIRRTTEVSDVILDRSGFILLDNIVVSYPAMRADLMSHGWYDETKSGKQTLGFENAWNVPFPGVGDELHPRAKPVFYTNPGDTNADVTAFITGANLHYRWRYLEQQVNNWETLALDPTTLTAPDTLNIKNAAGEVLPGDVEFWYDLRLNAPYYKYVDYADVAGFQMKDYYSEEVGAVTNRSELINYPTGGTNWFVRLREGQSDIERVELVLGKKVKVEGEDEVMTEVARVPFELNGNHQWRGYLKTAEKDSFNYRIEFLNEQVPGSTEWATNLACYVTEDVETFPVSAIMMEGTTNTWAKLPIDAATGYLMFQVDDRTKSISVVHADYLDVNGWTDAKGPPFVGSSTDGLPKSGVSPKAQDYIQDFDSWANMSATDPALWSEGFATTVDLGVKEYETFPSIDTPNGWSAGQGMYVYSHYKDAQIGPDGMIGRALQMEGQGRGYIQFVNGAKSPRGLESISFTARIGQFIEFGDFSYFDAPVKMEMTDYCFNARVSYDTNKNKDFSGNASLSLVAYYRPGVGAYEFRIEQKNATRDNNTKAATGTNRKSHLLSFYKWVYDQSTGQMNKTLLGSQDYTDVENPETTSMTGNFWPVYFSVSNDVAGAATCLMAGVRRDKAGTAYSAALDTDSNVSYFCIGYRDNTANRLTSGTYGVLTANCPGVFQTPFMSDKPIPYPDNSIETGKIKKWNTVNVKISGTKTKCLDDLHYGRWMLTPGRMMSYNSTTTNSTTGVVTPSDDYKWGLRARPLAPQAINVYTAPAGSQAWTKVATTNVATYGTAAQPGTPFTFNLYTTQDCGVRIAAAGTFADVRRDVVIDNIELRQWRGANWDDTELAGLIPDYVREDADGALHTNFVFSSGWIKNGGILLSAKRTIPGEPSSIRSPLMDGYEFTEGHRGIGLGMISFNYKNANENAKLLVQIATNKVTSSTLSTIDRKDGEWTTVTNFTFKGLSATELASGTRSCYIGLHGVKGLMRILIDPDTVIAADALVHREPNYGEITIDKVFCRDEPIIDTSCWRGWNIRTVGADETGKDAEKFLYLPDSGCDPKGRSLALNNSVTDSVNPDDKETYKQHLPFVQTPTFATNIVGEVTFRARRYDTASPYPAQVTVYGSKTGDEYGAWTKIDVGTPSGAFIISNNTYTTYNFKTNPNDDYYAFRLVVTGVDGVNVDVNMQDYKPAESPSAMRVLLDEIVVSEAVRAKMGFRNVGTIRGYPPGSLNDVKKIQNMPNANEQPLCEEGWGVQCEIFAAQLPDEIDFSREPRVRLYWYQGLLPWGYENWKTNALAKSAYLERAVDTPENEFVYRSTYYLNNGASVVPAVKKSPSLNNNVFQYMLEVEFYQVGKPDPVVQRMKVGDWTKPVWYDPVDYNADFGKGGAFAAYNILDTVAPKWAWINEVNILGTYERYRNGDAANQYLELVVPAEADITGWYVNFLSPKETAGAIVTNTVARFGQGDLAGKKPNNEGMISNNVFRVIASPSTKIAHPNGFDLPPCAQYDGTKATIDGTWNVSRSTDDLMTDGEIGAIYPIGIQLVRASGIVEHEVVAIGTNLWADAALSETTRLEHEPTNVVNFLNRVMPGAHFIFAGNDNISGETSLGVMSERGETSAVWSNERLMTPGRLNDGQSIDPNHPTANGESMIIFCNLDQSGGPIFQTIADAVNTNGSQVVFIQKGHATNITYRVGEWYELDKATADGLPLVPALQPAAREGGFEPYTWTVTVGGPAVSNGVTVSASAKVRSDIEASVPEKQFLPAVIDWLSNRVNLKGEPFAGDDLKETDYVPLGDYARYVAGELSETNKLSLLEQYWLDLDPTADRLALVAGSGTPTPHYVPESERIPAHTNVKVPVTMWVTNAVTGAVYAPYAIRGVNPGVSSYQNDAFDGDEWTSASFKITGVLMNGKTDITTGSKNHLPVRWFVFDEGSFDANFTTVVEVDDPTTKASPGYYEGWAGATDGFGWGWAIDLRRQPIPIEKLKPTNDLDSKSGQN